MDKTKNFQKPGFNLPLQARLTIAPMALGKEGSKFFEKYFHSRVNLCYDINKYFFVLLAKEEGAQLHIITFLREKLQHLCKINNYTIAYNAFSEEVFELYKKRLPKKCFSPKQKKDGKRALVRQWYLHHPETRELFRYWSDIREKYHAYKALLDAYCKGRNIND